MTEVRFQEVAKRFKEVAVITGLNLTIHSGEFFTFVGPSGCGKSTILNMIAGLETVTNGTISFDSNSINEMAPGERDVAMVFQSYALYPHMTVYENIAFPLRAQKRPEQMMDHEIHRVADLLGLAALLRRKPRELSGGQRQRVALARAIVRKPKVFLMDEPLSNLDARLRIETRGELKRLHHEVPTTTVYVTHDQEEAMVLSDRIAVLDQGKLQQCGSPMEVYEKPVNLFTAGFIGSPPMQFIEGKLLIDNPIVTPMLKGYDPNNLVIGIRPSDLMVYDSGSVPERGRTPLTPMQVTLLENTGNEVWVEGRWKETTLKGKAQSNHSIRAGAQAFFRVAAAHLHFFDNTTGNRLPF